MDKVGVRQAGGLGGDRPVCRVDGLNNRKIAIKFHFGSIYLVTVDTRSYQYCTFTVQYNPV